MYFQIDNTPERIKKQRKVKALPQTPPKEECPRLTCAPFSKPPQILFENVLVGTSCTKYLELLNPSKETQKITLSKTAPCLFVNIPGDYIELEPQTCYCIELVWTPIQQIVSRETIRFTNEKRGRFDVIVVLKSVLPEQTKKNKTSPGKVVKKKSNLNITKDKVEIFNKTRELVKTVNVVKRPYSIKPMCDDSLRSDNISIQNPFDTDISRNITFDISEVFKNRQYGNPEPPLHETYDKPETCVLKTSNKPNIDTSLTNFLDNITFTPLKSITNKTENLSKGPKIVVSINSDTEFDDSLEIKEFNKENEKHNLIRITSNHNTENRWQTDADHLTPYMKKIAPQTSSPKDGNSPNFSINTDVSRISDMSFFPHRFSTEKKTFPKSNVDEVDDNYLKLNTDTFTKESPLENFGNRVEMRQTFLIKEPRMCKQALFKEQELNRNCFNQEIYNHLNQLASHNDFRADLKSPPRSITPPLQSIPEESFQYSDAHATFEKCDPKMETFAFNKTYDKHDVSFRKQSGWSKKAVVKSRTSGVLMNNTYISNKSVLSNTSVKYIPNAYSQSLTVNPFSSLTQFYDDALIKKYEIEFKRWLNYILTPSDLESNIEQKVDVCKIWIQTRNTEVPTAPTKEKVCSSYHNSHRLESLRKSAKSLLKSAEISEVLQKLNAKIDKKLICIRDDRNLHLDIGLQKTIMELILSYNPLWLRIGLEVIYNLVLPLKSNSDIEGLTSFVVQRLFKNPFLKNKNSKSAPNVLRPAYVEAIKKFTLKKFFTLVFFLDQAKQRKLIAHDPCLFCRYAICKESREILIRFNKDLISGSGDITKQLRPIGYVVVHKQTYLDEYRYGVEDIAVDLRDGVRLTKVSEIILIKDNLMKQLRAPAISRLQKIHNVEVALKALREEKFHIEGEITSTDIADGHREKTLSLLWQLIHVFRAPLFQKAANVIQMWWRKKYEVILEKRRIEEEKVRKLNKAAEIIQLWWRKIQYRRRLRAMIAHQRYLWVLKIEAAAKILNWYRNIKNSRAIRQQFVKTQKAAITIQQRYRALKKMKLDRTRFLSLKSACITIQMIYRANRLCKRTRKMYVTQKMAAIKIQNWYRRCVETRKRRHEFIKLRQATVAVQQRYRAQKKMRVERERFLALKSACIFVQRAFIAKKLYITARQAYIHQRNAIINIQKWYRSWKLTRQLSQEYTMLRKATVLIQQRYRAQKKMRLERQKYLALRSSCIFIQRLYRANRLCKYFREMYLTKRNAIIQIQKWYRYCKMTIKLGQEFVKLKQATVVIQQRYRAQKKMQEERQRYLSLRSACIFTQRLYRANRLCRNARESFIKQKSAITKIQTWYRNLKNMQQTRQHYLNLRKATFTIQQLFRAQKKMRFERNRFIQLKSACITLQRRYRANRLCKDARAAYIELKSGAIRIQNWYKSCKKTQMLRQEYVTLRQASIILQRRYRAQRNRNIERNRYIRLRNACIAIQRIYRANRLCKKAREAYTVQRNAAITIQIWYRNIKLTNDVRKAYKQTKRASLTIQNYYRSYIMMKHQRTEYLKIRTATITIQRHYRCYKEMKLLRQHFVQLKTAAICIQKRFRALKAMKNEREQFLVQKKSAVTIQTWFRCVKLRKEYLRIKTAAIMLQRKIRAHNLMKYHRKQFIITKIACIRIQRFFRAYQEGKKHRTQYLAMLKAARVVQTRYRALMSMRKERQIFLSKKSAALVIQRRYRAYKLMVVHRSAFITLVSACVLIQRKYRAYIQGNRDRTNFVKLRNSITKIQRWYRSVVETRKTHQKYAELRRNVIFVQSMYRMVVIRREYLKLREAAIKIQRFYRLYLLMKRERTRYQKLKNGIVKLQALSRCFVENKKYQRLRKATLLIQFVYRFKKAKELKILQAKRESAAVSIQKNWRRHVDRTRFKKYVRSIIIIQRFWKSTTLMRKIRHDFLLKKQVVTKLQALIRGFLIRKKLEAQKQHLKLINEQLRRNRAATIIQAHYRGFRVRANSGEVLATLRENLRACNSISDKRTLGDITDEALDILSTTYEIRPVLEAFKDLEYTTSICPQKFAVRTSKVVERVLMFMSVVNRSISSVLVLTYGISLLINLVRYHVTGPLLYSRKRISPILTYMVRYSPSEQALFCRLATYIWLFSKYEDTKKDLEAFLHEPDNIKMMLTIKRNVERLKKIESNSTKMKLSTPQPVRKMNYTQHLDMSVSMRRCSIASSQSNISSISQVLLPSFEPDYGITLHDKPRYFTDPLVAIQCIFSTFNIR